MIGAGIFATVGTAAAGNPDRPGAGPAIILSFLLTGVACAFCALCYAELASLIPISGSAYTYAYATLGELIAWIIGWDLILEYAFGAATVASGWAGTVNSFLQDFGIHFPPQFTDTPGRVLVLFEGRWAPLLTLQQTLAEKGIDPSTLPHVTAVFNLLAFLAIVGVTTAILVVGIKESADFNSFIVFVKVGAVLIFIVVAAMHVLKDPAAATNDGQGARYWNMLLQRYRREMSELTAQSTSEDRELPDCVYTDMWYDDEEELP